MIAIFVWCASMLTFLALNKIWDWWECHFVNIWSWSKVSDKLIFWPDGGARWKVRRSINPIFNVSSEDHDCFNQNSWQTIQKQWRYFTPNHKWNREYRHKNIVPTCRCWGWTKVMSWRRTTPLAWLKICFYHFNPGNCLGKSKGPIQKHSYWV